MLGREWLEQGLCTFSLELMEVGNKLVCSLDEEVPSAHMLGSRTEDMECTGRNESTWAEVGRCNALVVTLSHALNQKCPYF